MYRYSGPLLWIHIGLINLYLLLDMPTMMQYNQILATKFATLKGAVPRVFRLTVIRLTTFFDPIRGSTEGF